MGSTGPQWSLYPLLAIIAFCEFSCGLIHLSFCLPFYFLLLPLINGVLGLLAAFHAIFLRYPNRCDFFLQITCAVLSFLFFSSSLLETYCLGDFAEHDKSLREGVCYGMRYRTSSLVTSCSEFLGTFQLSILAKIDWEPKDRESVRFFISCSLTVLSGIHLFCTTSLTFYSAIETKIRLYSYHYQLAVGVLIFLTGVFHLRFCCTFFFLGLPLVIGIYSIIQGWVSWRSRCHGSVCRSMNIIGAAMALILLAASIFGVVCWVNRNSTPHAITRHCHWRPEAEEYCIRVVHFSHPYIDWLDEETDREIAIVQIIVYVVLFLLSLMQFCFSMRSAFSTKDIQLYY